MLMREHRLYQVDWLIRKYGFSQEDILFEKDGNLSLAIDPKEQWARKHPEFFPVDVNRAGKNELLRVPGLGPVTVGRILQMRSSGTRINSVSMLGKPGKRLQKTQEYIRYS